MGRLGEEIVVSGTVTAVEDGVATVESQAVQSGKRIIRNAVAELGRAAMLGLTGRCARKAPETGLRLRRSVARGLRLGVQPSRRSRNAGTPDRPAVRGARPRCWGGGAEFTVTGYGATTVCSSCLRGGRRIGGQVSGALAAQRATSVTRLSVIDGWAATARRCHAAKLNALVRSPVARRQALRFGTSAPKRVSRKRRVEVWSNTSLDTKPPRLNGETTSIGYAEAEPDRPRDAAGVGGQRV